MAEGPALRWLRRVLGGCALLLAVAVLCLLPLHQNGSIRTEVSIRCSPQQVWQILTATQEYPLWNPMISNLKGELREGNVIEFTSGMTFHPTILRVRPAQELRWKGSVLVPGLFDGEHRFLLMRQGMQTQLIQSEEFSGLLAGRLTRGILRETTENMNEMNTALKQRCESLPGNR